MTPEAIVQSRLDAYNASDLDRFLALYSENVQVFRPPNLEPVIVGKGAFGEFYAAKRFNKEGLHAELVHRIVIGNKVIDHERISGAREQPFEVVIAYEVVNDLIANIWFFTAD